jgi:hypothetical protein
MEPELRTVRGPELVEDAHVLSRRKPNGTLALRLDLPTPTSDRL